MVTGKELIPSRDLAVAIFYLLARAAAVYYPGSTRAHPSPFVRVSQQKEGPLPGMAKGLLPLDVRESLWRLVVVPVLEKEVWAPLGFLPRGFNNKRDPWKILEIIQNAVDQAYRDAGFAP